MAQRKYSEAQRESARKWDSVHLDRLSIALPAGSKDKIKAHADAHGESVNKFIARAITETIERDSTGEPQEAAGAPVPSEMVKVVQEATGRAVESILKKPKSTEKRYKGGGTKEYREMRESIEKIAADMYDVDKHVEYTIDDLIEEIRVNAEAYVRQLRRTLEIRSALLTDENKPTVLTGIERHVFQKLRDAISLPQGGIAQGADGAVNVSE